MPRVLKLTMVEALKYLASFSEKGEGTIIEDRYCLTCTIEQKIGALENLEHDVDYSRDLIVGVGGIYSPDETYPGGARPIYGVLV